MSVEKTQMAETVKKAKAPAKPRKAAAKTAPAVEESKPALVKTEAKREVTHEEISKLAHRFWAERGHQHGSPEQDWLRAEQELRGKAS
jgi:hypothetical protein